MPKKRKVDGSTVAYVADFETTTKVDDCRVWGWAASRVYNVDNVVYGDTLDEFMDWLTVEHPQIVYFHNEAFDGSFIIDWLFRHGFQHAEKEEDFGMRKFMTLISRLKKVYAITIMVDSGHRVEIYDSLKLFPMPVRSVAQAFNLKEGKGECDYEKERPVGYHMTVEERDYIRRDVQIVTHAIEANYNSHLTSMTIGSNAMNWYKSIRGDQFYRDFPVLSLDVDAYLRRAYRGGFTYVNPEYAGKDVGPGISVDYNSMYPSMMISKPYPIGLPEHFTGKYVPDEKYPLFVQTITCMFKVKPRGIPMIQIHNAGFYGEHEYVEETVEPVQLTLTSVDLALFEDNYDVDIISYDGGMKFMQKSGRSLFGFYVNYWGKKKRTSKGAARAIAKLMLNNLYGKFSSNPDVTQKIPVFNYEKNLVEYKLGKQELKKPTYLPVGEFCTAYARDTLIRAIMANRDRFVYCDTDSMHLLGTEEPEGLRLHDTDFCAWKVEGTFTRARHLRAKCYIWDLNGKLGVTCAGMSPEIKAHCTFDNFHFGFRNYDMVDGEKVPREGWDKLVPVTVPGGVVLRKVAYELKDNV